MSTRIEKLNKLKSIIKSGDLDWDYGDQWYGGMFAVFSLKEQDNIEDSLVTYFFEESSRDYHDESWTGWQEQGEAKLGEILDFIENRKFGNKDAEISFNSIKELFEDSLDEIFQIQERDDFYYPGLGGDDDE